MLLNEWNWKYCPQTFWIISQKCFTNDSFFNNFNNCCAFSTSVFAGYGFGRYLIFNICQVSWFLFQCQILKTNHYLFFLICQLVTCCDLFVYLLLSSIIIYIETHFYIVIENLIKIQLRVYSNTNKVEILLIKTST